MQLIHLLPYLRISFINKLFLFGRLPPWFDIFRFHNYFLDNWSSLLGILLLSESHWLFGLTTEPPTPHFIFISKLNYKLSESELVS